MFKLNEVQAKSLERLINTLDRSHSAFHSTKALCETLDNHGFVNYTGKVFPNLTSGMRGYVMKNQSAVIAFQIGTEPQKHGLKIIGTHTDSPCLKIKPNSVIVKDGAITLNAEVYGGPLLNTWFDRPLSFAGRVLIETATGIETRLVDIPRPVLILPNMCIHMNREANEGVAINRQKVLLPIIALAESYPQDKDHDITRIIEEVCAAELGINAEQILDYDLYTYVFQKAMITGLYGEFLSSARQDNMPLSHAAIQAISSEFTSPATCIVMCCDNEEVGSQSMQGANSTYFRDMLESIYLASGGDHAGFLNCLNNSFMISADQAHAIHPNYSEYYDPTNRTMINKGPVIKQAARLSYMTDGVSAGYFRYLCKEAGVPCQSFVNHNNHPGGSTIGSITASYLHCRGVDVGNPLWGMHSARETGGVLDGYYMEEVLKHFLSTPKIAIELND